MNRHGLALLGQRSADSLRWEPSFNTLEIRDTNGVFTLDRELNKGEDVGRVVLDDRINGRKIGSRKYQSSGRLFSTALMILSTTVASFKGRTYNGTTIGPRHLAGIGQPTHWQVAFFTDAIQVVQYQPIEQKAPERPYPGILESWW